MAVATLVFMGPSIDRAVLVSCFPADGVGNPPCKPCLLLVSVQDGSLQTEGQRLYLMELCKIERRRQANSQNLKRASLRGGT